MSAGIIGGNVKQQSILAVTLSPVSVAANTTAEQLFTLPNNQLLPLNSTITVNKPSTQAGLGVVGFRVAADGRFGITFGNFTASPIVPTANEVYNVMVEIPENPTLKSNFSF